MMIVDEMNDYVMPIAIHLIQWMKWIEIRT